MDHNIISVRVIKMGAPINNWPLQPGSTVSDLCEVADLDFKQGGFTRRNQLLCEDTRLFDNDIVIVADVVKGNVDPFEVEIFRLGGGSSVSLPAQDGMSLRNVLEQLNPEQRSQFFRANGDPAYEFSISGSKVTLDTTVSRNSANKVRIIASQVVKGNISQAAEDYSYSCAYMIAA